MSSLSTNLRSSQSACNLPAVINDCVSISTNTSSSVNAEPELLTVIAFLYNQLELYQDFTSALSCVRRYATGAIINTARVDAIIAVLFEIDILLSGSFIC